MRKLLLILLFLPAVIFAAPVSKERANAIGKNFFSKSIEAHRVAGKQAHFVAQQQPNMRKVRQSTGNSYAPYYIFNNEGGGFVIVAGDDCATPILGYSTEGSIDLSNLPIQLEELLNAYAEEIQLAVENNDQPTDSIQALWDAYYRAPQSQNATAAVNALITTTWHQYPRYNNKCPVDASLSNLGGHPTTGCVATAMAQVMKYWEYPSKGYGSKSYRSEHYGTLSADFGSTAYDWDNMPTKLSSSTSSTQNNAVATLMYHCGVAVSMNYNSDGYGSSGANTLDWGGGRASAETALKTYFGYASTLEGKQSSSMSASAWKSLLKTELDNQRPMLYRGVSSQGGHCFICDGYDSNDKFHFNWGWGGNSNGFFSITAGTSGCHEFSQDQCAVVGIRPKDGSSPAKNYDLYMNTDLTATNTSSSTSSEPNAYYFGNTMSFTAKVENNGTGTFNGYLKVGAFTDGGEFIAWSNESYHFSLEAGKNTVQKAYTFTGGVPFLPGKYRAYMYYQDDDETESKKVKTDEGVFLTEYNNIAFTVKAIGDLQIGSKYSIYDQIFSGYYTTGNRARINVDVKNTSSSKFYGKIRLGLYNMDGSLAELIEDLDYTNNGFPANSTVNLQFYNIIDVEPGTYHLILKAQKKNQSSWYYLGCTTTYPNPINFIVQAPALYPDVFEPNNTQPVASNLLWDLDPEMADFDATYVTLHEDADIDYYKLVFPKANKYKVNVSIGDKYIQGYSAYLNADIKYAYSIGGNSYSEYYKENKAIALDGPNILYIRVRQYGLNGVGFYDMWGEIEETANPNIQDVTCAEASQIAAGLSHNSPTSQTYNVLGYVTETDGVVSKGQQIFWMADTENGGQVFQCYWGNVPEAIQVGDYVSLKGNILRYNSTYEIKHGDVLLVERKSSEGIDDIEVTSPATKILRDGQILILRGDKTYTITGTAIK